MIEVLGQLTRHYHQARRRRASGCQKCFSAVCDGCHKDAEKLAIRIRVCLQAYRNRCVIIAPLGAAMQPEMCSRVSD